MTEHDKLAVFLTRKGYRVMRDDWGGWTILRGGVSLKRTPSAPCDWRGRHRLVDDLKHRWKCVAQGKGAW